MSASIETIGAYRTPLASNQHERTGWYVYDWTNSAFATTVAAVFLGPYLTTIAKALPMPMGSSIP